MKRVLLVLLVAFAGTCDAQDIGRLFFTAEQRNALDARRKARVPDKPTAVPQAASPTTRLDGFVRRSQGRSTVWVNGESLGESGPEAPRIEPGRGTGEVRDVIGNGEIQVRRPAGRSP